MLVFEVLHLDSGVGLFPTFCGDVVPQSMSDFGARPILWWNIDKALATAFDRALDGNEISEWEVRRMIRKKQATKKARTSLNLVPPRAVLSDDRNGMNHCFPKPERMLENCGCNDRPGRHSQSGKKMG